MKLRPWYAVEIVAWFLVVCAFSMALFFLAGCGTVSDRQTQTVEREKLIAGPMTIDTPVGQFVMQPTTIERQRTQDEVERTEKRIQAPEVGQFMTAAASSTPWGGIIAGVIGLGSAAMAGKKAMEVNTLKRHRDQLIDGMEDAREHLPDDLDEKVCKSLAAKQDADLQRIIQHRTA